MENNIMENKPVSERLALIMIALGDLTEKHLNEIKELQGQGKEISSKLDLVAELLRITKQIENVIYR